MARRKGLICTYFFLTKRDITHRDGLPNIARKCGGRSRRSMAHQNGFISKYKHTFLSHKTGQNSWSYILPLLGTSNTNVVQMLGNTEVDLGVLWRVEKASFGGISTHLYFTKWARTHRDMFTLSWYQQPKYCADTRKHGGQSWRSIARRKGFIWVY
jgi:hypothetical protein